MRRPLTLAIALTLLGCPADDDPAPAPEGAADTHADAAAPDAGATDTKPPEEDTPAPQDTPTPSDTPTVEDSADVGVGLPEGTEDPPPVPGTGWAKAVVSSQIAPSIDVNGTNTPNVAANTDKVIGPPQGDVNGILALGLVGDHVVVDLGEGTEAVDEEGPDIVVVEYGLAQGGFPEPYRVYGSAEPEGPFTAIGDGAGERGFDLAGTGLAAARYIKVESQATLELVTSGLGSPLYPGPEIDAIGAVNPGGLQPPGGDASMTVKNVWTSTPNFDGAWQAGEVLTVTATLANDGPADFLWYPGVALKADSEEVTIAPEDAFWFYAILAQTTLEASFTVTPDETLAPGTLTFEASVVSLNCDNSPIDCPPPVPVSIEVIYGAAACCTVDGQCSDVAQETCVAAPDYHSWNKEQSCSTITCPDETQGACCEEGGGCMVATADLCATAGQFMGKDTKCEDVTCP